MVLFLHVIRLASSAAASTSHPTFPSSGHHDHTKTRLPHPIPADPHHTGRKPPCRKHARDCCSTQRNGRGPSGRSMGRSRAGRDNLPTGGGVVCVGPGVERRVSIAWIRLSFPKANTETTRGEGAPSRPAGSLIRYPVQAGRKRTAPVPRVRFNVREGSAFRK